MRNYGTTFKRLNMQINRFDEIYDNFLDQATTQDFRRVSDVDCNFCGGDGIFTDKEDWFDGSTTLQVNVPVICPCVEANEDGVIKYWENKKDSNDK